MQTITELINIVKKRMKENEIKIRNFERNLEREYLLDANYRNLCQLEEIEEKLHCIEKMIGGSNV